MIVVEPSFDSEHSDSRVALCLLFGWDEESTICKVSQTSMMPRMANCVYSTLQSSSPQFESRHLFCVEVTAMEKSRGNECVRRSYLGFDA